MKSLFTSYLTYSRSQRSGLFALLILISGFQLAYIFLDFSTPEKTSKESQAWLDLQKHADSLKGLESRNVPTIYPFNPNYITDFKGYKLGMSVQEIDRLHTFRKRNKYVNSTAEFQAVTKVSDSLLSAISPYFKFPEWVKASKKFSAKKFDGPAKIVRTDINRASKEELIKVYGVGEATSERILRMKEKLGGFISIEQMDDVWGLSEDAVANLKKQFEVLQQPEIIKIAVNRASVKELSGFPYFRYALAREIVTYRSMNGEIKNSEDLLKVKGFPVEKVGIIAVYLEF